MDLGDGLSRGRFGKPLHPDALTWKIHNLARFFIIKMVMIRHIRIKMDALFGDSHALEKTRPCHLVERVVDRRKRHPPFEAPVKRFGGDMFVAS